MGEQTRYVSALTAAQREQMEAHAQKWIDRGWRITPLTEAEWAVWEDGARYFYELADIPFPKTIVRVPSPMVGAFAAPIVAYILAKLRKDGVIPGSAVGSAVRSAVRSAVDSAVDSTVRSTVDSGERDVLRVVRDTYYRWFGGAFGGGWWSWATSPAWQAYWTFFRDVVGLELDGDLWERVSRSEAASSAGYWWPFGDFVMVCDNPVELHVETAGGEARMHCETGPAISRIWSRRADFRAAELAKCQVLCRACHDIKSGREDAEHGTEKRYRKHGCRCSACTEWNRGRRRRQLERQRQQRRVA